MLVSLAGKNDPSETRLEGMFRMLIHLDIPMYLFSSIWPKNGTSKSLSLYPSDILLKERHLNNKFSFFRIIQTAHILKGHQRIHLYHLFIFFNLEFSKKIVQIF